MGQIWGIIAGIEFILLVAAVIYFVLGKNTSEAEKEAIQVKNLLDLIMELIKSYLLVTDEEGRIIICSSSLAEEVKAESKESLQGVYVHDLGESFRRWEEDSDIGKELKENGSVDKIYELSQEGGTSLWLDVKAHSLKQGDKLVGNLILCSDVTKDIQGKEELLRSISHELRTPMNAIAGSLDMLCLSKNLGENERSHVGNIKEAYRTMARRVDKITEYSNIKNEKLTVENREFVIQEIFDVVRNAVYIRTCEKGIGFLIDVSPAIPLRLYGDVKKISSVLLHLLLNRTKQTKEGYVRLSIQPVYHGDRLFLKYEISDTGEHMSEKEIKGMLETEDGKTMGEAIGFSIGKEYVRAMGGEIRAESTYDSGNRFWFELETKAITEQKSIELIDAEEKSVMFCAGVAWKNEHMRTMLRELGIGKAECYSGKESLTESVWSHIIIDSSFAEASEILKRKLPYPCKKILILEASRMVIDGLQEADIILYEPFHIFMLAGILNQEENKKKKQTAEENLMFKTKGVKALVVDDNEVNLMVCCDILKQFGIETEEADSGVMAVQKYYANDYDFIMMDYLMPGIDGVEAIRRIRSMPKKSAEPVIIALSANITKEIRQQFEDAGAQEVMAKPLELKELSQMLRRWLKKEQITESEEEKKELARILSAEALQSVLRDVKGLNTEVGLNHILNSVEGYIKILKACDSNITEQIEHIKAGYHLVAAVDLKIGFHSLKGIFSNIGAEKLAEESRKLELEANNNNEEFIASHLEEYVSQVEEFVEELHTALSLYKDILDATTEEEEALEPMPPETYFSLLEKAKEAVRQYDFADIMQILEELRRGSQGENRENLSKALEEMGEFRYDAVMEILERIK